ncbi:MAG: putative ATPase [Akkermansiaceae bacterium]|jgi:predicted ATPase
MLRNVSFKNFCSLRRSGEWDLTAGASTPIDDSFVLSKRGDHVTLLSGVFGPNASGKTNLLKTLSFLNFFLRSSYRDQDAEERIPIDRFSGNDEPVELGLEFEGPNRIYRYELKLTPERIIEERLRYFHPETKSFRSLLLRKAGKRGPLISQPGGGDFTDLAALRKLLQDRPNASIIAAGLLTGRQEFKKIDQALGLFETNVNRMGKSDLGHASHTSQLIDCARYFRENDHLLEEVEAHLKQADLGISGFEIRDMELVNEEKGSTHKVPFPFVSHKSANGSFELPITQESSGTRRIFTLMRQFLPVLTNGGVAVIDEMESDLHPHLIPMLLNLFVDFDTNPKRAQLLFTCHHVEALNSLAKEQIVLVDKNDLNETEAYRLSDRKGVRRDENHFSNYNAGRYGATPEPSLF